MGGGSLHSSWWQRPGHLSLVKFVPVLSQCLFSLEVVSTLSFQVFKLPEKPWKGLEGVMRSSQLFQACVFPTWRGGTNDHAL